MAKVQKKTQTPVSRDNSNGNAKKPDAVKKRSARTASAGKRQRSFPPRSLEEAIKIPSAIKTGNNGHPWATEDVAQASLGVNKSNNRFFYLAAASRDYGLTIGSRDTEEIGLSELGREIVYASDEHDERQKKIDAFLSVDIFKRVFEHFGGSHNFPKKEFLSNTLQREFDLDPECHDEFIRIFRANCEYLGTEKEIDESSASHEAVSIEHPRDVRVVGEPKGKFDRTAFVIMPFSEKGGDPRPKGFFSEVLNTLITPAANSVGFAVETADETGTDVIQSTIIDQLLKAELVVADLSDHNPNVLFELGIRIARDLPVALIKSSDTKPIFDVDNLMRVLTYDPNLWTSTVKHDIPKIATKIKTTWDNRASARTYMQILTTGRTQGAETSAASIL
ncbi:MAG: hypothetical protein R3C10_15110 [Pirellulales bacterium]